MLSARLIRGRGVPLWAIAAPAIGVPLLVGLLAVAAPKDRMPVDDAAPDVQTEQLEPRAAGHATDLRAHCSRQPNSS